MVTSVLAIVIVVRMPADYFSKKPPPRTLPIRILRNLLGAAIVIVGIVLSVPGIPGQGLLMIFIGLLLLDFPGKHRVMRWFVSRRRIRGALNRIRRRFGKEPLAVD